MQCLIIGYGSIGKRHAQILKSLGCEIQLVTSQKIKEHDCYPTIESALKNKSIDYVILATPTHLHYSSLISLIQSNYEKIVLVEKPLYTKVECLPENKFLQLLIAYNLRFHELLIQAKKLIADEKLITLSAYVGQYLPSWRKNRDYRSTYSANKDQGGGVLRDLSHELDYSLWLCGSCQHLTAMGGHFSSLEINSDDAYSIMMKCTRCPMVNLHVNYLDRYTRREITINTDKNTIFIDLVKGQLIIDGEIKAQCENGVAQTYLNQHQAVLMNNFDSFCGYEEGLYVMNLIEKIELAAASQKWMKV